MNKMAGWCFLILSLCALPPWPARAETLNAWETRRADAEHMMPASLAALAVQLREQQPLLFPASPVRPAMIIPPCANSPVVEISNGDIRKNGWLLGHGAVSYQTSCGGGVAWLDNRSRLYRDQTALGEARLYEIATYSNAVVWVDRFGILCKDLVQLGQAKDYDFVRITGDVVWTDRFGLLHKNSSQLGKASSCQIAPLTGDVGWLDHFRNLYKNGFRVAGSVDSFTLREDGVLIWRDPSGHYHSA